jgi:hypothetical protein
MEGFSPTNGSAGNSAPVGGRRHRSVKKVSAKTIRRTLRKLGMKPKGRVVLKGGEGAPTPDAAAPSAPPAGGRRHHSRKSRRGGRRHRSRSLFGLRY